MKQKKPIRLHYKESEIISFMTTASEKFLNEYFDTDDSQNNTACERCLSGKSCSYFFAYNVPCGADRKCHGPYNCGLDERRCKIQILGSEPYRESVNRSGYIRIGKGKHSTITNAHPILFWNTVEIFLYLFQHSLPINDAYRKGKR